MKREKKVGLVGVLAEIKAGLSPSKISQKYDLPKQNISYFVCKLKKLGCIERKGYATWEFLKDLKEVKRVPKGSARGQSFTSSKKEIRGHAFIWKISFMKDYDWKEIVKLYKKKKLTFITICGGKVPRTIFHGRKIWMTKQGMVIYEPLDFFGRSGFQVKGTAVFEMDHLLKDLFKELGLKFYPYKFTTSREHFGMIKNELARQFNKKKEKLMIKGEDGSVWLWIDDSESLSELETKDPEISRQVQKFWNDHKKHKFKVDAGFILNVMAKQSEGIMKNTEHLEFHAENMRSHVKAVKQLGENVEKQTKIFEIVLKRLEERN